MGGAVVEINVAVFFGALVDAVIAITLTTVRNPSSATLEKSTSTQEQDTSNNGGGRKRRRDDKEREGRKGTLCARTCQGLRVGLSSTVSV